MAVYARCTACKTRRDKSFDDGKECADKSGHKRSVVWTANVQFIRNGPRYSESFDTEELALKQERKWKVEYDENRLVVKRRVEYRSFESVADEWVRMATAHNIVKGKNNSDVYRVNRFKTVFAKRDINSLQYKDGMDYITTRRENEIAIGTINREMKPLQWIMNYAVNQGYIPANPFLKIKPMKGANVHDRWMTVAELNRLYDAARALQDDDLFDFIAVGINTGFRLGNLIRLTARDISNNRILARQTKSGEPYDVPIAPGLVPTLKKLVAMRPEGALLRTSHIGVRFRRAAELAGLWKKDDLQRVTIHTLRHTFAVLYLNRGGELYDLSKMLGHAGTAITDKIYARFSKERKDANAPLISTPVPDRIGSELRGLVRADVVLD